VISDISRQWPVIALNKNRLIEQLLHTQPAHQLAKLVPETATAHLGL
jgi:hypothetical protein